MAESPPRNLPAQLTTLIGRTGEIETLTRLLRDDGVRFLTLTGSGGSGKTRLAIETASAIVDSFSGGVFFVSLAPISEPQLIASAIAQTLGVRESGGALPLEAIEDSLNDRHVLLILDNFEQVVEGAPIVAGLLLACPALQVLITSRAALHIRGEREFPVPPLAIPDRSRPLDLQELRRYAAISLFIDRAQAVNPDFRVSEEAVRQVADICARLDGLPLAIELAAARSKVLTPAATLARLDRRFSLLAGGARDLPERQRTLRGAIGWSYDLLDAAEQALFRRLSVFAGGCTLEAAEQLCREWHTRLSPGGPNGGGVDADARSGETLNQIASLVDKNLVQAAATQGSEVRFAFLETVREFGLEALDSNEELQETRRIHTGLFLRLAEEAEEHLTDAGRDIWLRRLEQEHDNLRAGLRWCREQNLEEEGLRLAGALGPFWHFQGYASEGRQWLDAALALGEQQMTATRAKALTAAGILAVSQHDYADARRYHEQSLAIYRGLSDEWSAAVATNDLGTVALYQGDYPTAAGLYQASLELRQMLGDQRGCAVSLTNLGLVAAARRELSLARQFHEQGLALRRELGDRAGMTRSLSHLGVVASEQRDYDAARAYLSEAMGFAKEDGDLQAISTGLVRLGTVASAAGELDEANALLENAVALQREHGDHRSLPWSLWHLSRVALARGQPAVARAYCDEMLEMVRGTGDKHGLALWLQELADIALGQDDYERARSALEEGLTIRRQLGDEAGAAVTMARLAQVEHHDGDPLRARTLLDESVQVLRRLDDRAALAASLTNLAQILLVAGEVDAAQTAYQEALVLHQELGNADMIGLSLRGLASIAELRGHDERGQRLRAAADAVTTGALEPAALARLAGVDDALEPAEATIPHPDNLTDRELAVLRLIAAGRSNRAIADELYISVNTVFRHVSNVFAKTGASNRVEAAAYAQRHELV